MDVMTVMVSGRFVRLGNLHPANSYQHIAYFRIGMTAFWKNRGFPRYAGIRE